MSSPAADSKVPPAFVIVLFAAAIVVGVVVAYLGITGSIGAGIP